MAGRGELREARLRLTENVVRLLEPLLLEQRPAEDDLRAADLVEEVVPTRKQL